ncbi:YceI family protein [uncultured Algibacter sp.]|uniref:YceI family protein n=1 Tax=uncultured Algibacter sp. TaxID=298659 RepID=UPI00260BCAC6|nr:YceI family protein [uncultured Algibacter sp.]
MNKVLYIIAFLVSIYTFSQEKYLTKTGNVSFEGSVATFEEVKAINNSVTAIINTENGEFAALVFVKGFRFKNALMEEHFNENYAESDLYPKATFKGQLKNLDLINIASKKDYSLSGILNFHGSSKQMESTTVSIERTDDSITMSGYIKVLASDFDIKIPKIVKNKIAEDININFSFVMKKQ